MTDKTPIIYHSPLWSRNVKLIVGIVGFIFLLLLIWRFQSVVTYVVIAGILAYVLDPIISTIYKNTPLGRVPTLIIVYFTFLLILIGLVSGLVAVGFVQVQNLVNQVPDYIDTFTDWANRQQGRTFSLGPLSFSTPNAGIDWEAAEGLLIDNLRQSWGNVLGRGGQVVGGVFQFTFSLAGLLTNFLLIFIMSIYLSIDAPTLETSIADRTNVTGYQQDAIQLYQRFTKIWRSYLRGQIILGVVIFFVVWISLSLLGVNNPFALGLLSGLMEFLPIVGPFIGTVTAIIVALFQETNWLGLSPLWFAVVVGVVMFIIQQVENSVLVPRIVGRSLDLNPLLIMAAVIMGTSVAGVLGAVLAAPVTATILLVARYAWRKMFDLPPFPDLVSEAVAETTKPNGLEQVQSFLSGEKKGDASTESETRAVGNGSVSPESVAKSDSPADQHPDAQS